jgi:sulfur-oxidizing protein SoxY
MPPTDLPRISRRTLVKAGGLGTIALALPAQAQLLKPGSPEAVLDRLVGGRKARSGKVEVRAPELADNGNTVPVTVAVESPMSEQDFVRAIHVVADGNPNPEVLSAQLSPANGRAEISARIRLAKTQRVVAYAEFSDGSVWAGEAAVRVTIGGCGE